MSDTTLARRISESAHRTPFAMRVTLIVAAALALLGSVLFGLGTEAEVAALPPIAPAAAGVDEGDAGASPDEISAVPLAVTYEIFLDRDPFEPVVEEEVPAPQPVAGGTGADGQPTTDPNPTGTPVSPSDGSGSDGPRCTGTEEVVCGGQVVSLLDTLTTADSDGQVDGDRNQAVIQVGTIVYEVSVGRTFAESFELLAIDGDCTNLRYNEELFRICVPDEVLK